MRPEKDAPQRSLSLSRPGFSQTYYPALGRLTPHEAISVIPLGNISRFPDFLIGKFPLDCNLRINLIVAKESHDGIKRDPKG